MALKNKFYFKKFAFFSGIISGLFGLGIKAYAIFDTLATPIRIALEIITWSAIIFGASFAFVYTSNAILGWVTTPGFIRLKVTENPLVLQGWQVTRDFVNLFFILLVIWIGISIALRIGEGQAKKALPRLVIVALLINFTPVVCGVIIDASNIIMNFFLSAGTAGNSNLLNISSLSGGILLSSFEGLRGNWFDGSAWAAAFFQLMFVVAFNFIAGLIMLLVAILLVVRHVALWVLVILAPLAFFAWIFPTGGMKKIWSEWWKQFIQWCFVGIGAGFFLFLTQVAITNIGQIANIGNNPVVGPGGRVFLSSLFTQLIIYSVPLILLLVGFFATIQSAPMGAERITKMAERQMNKLPGRLKKLGGWGAGKVGERWEKLGPVEKARQAARERARQRLEWKAQKPPSWISAKGERVQRMKEAIVMPTWRARKLVPEMEKEIKDFNTLLSKYKSFKSTESRLAALEKGGLSSTERAAIIRAMFERGEIDKLPKETLQSFVRKDLLRVSPQVRKKIVEAIPDLAEEERQRLNDEIKMALIRGEKEKAQTLQQEKERKGLVLKEEDIKKGYRNIIDMVIGEAGPKEIENFSKELIKNKNARAAMHKFWSGREVSKAIEKFGRTFLDLFQRDINETGAEWYQKHNRKLYRYLRSNAAQNLGLEAPLTEEERQKRGIPIPKTFHAGKKWQVLSDKEKARLRKSLRLQKDMDKFISILGIPQLQKEVEQIIKTFGPEEARRIILEGDIERLPDNLRARVKEVREVIKRYFKYLA